jgi:TfoX/Sxy family transcriptional regulator of competence genes
MAYNETLEGEIEKGIRRWKDSEKKKMFGGICYLLRGNMAFGIWKDHLIVRAGPETAEKKLKEKGTKPFDVTGKVMKGWVMVAKTRWSKPDDLKSWLNLGKEFALSLPPKKKRG